MKHGNYKKSFTSTLHGASMQRGPKRGVLVTTIYCTIGSTKFLF